MVNPVPGHSVTTGYKKTSTGSWGTCGWHTGQDYAAPAGTNVVAARAGTVVHVDYGNSLGEHQFVIRPGDGTEDFYAHTSTRPSNGSKVSAGQYVSEVGSEGNATGPHLHFERHSSYGWNCGLMDDPMKSHNASGGGSGGGSGECSSNYPKPTSKTVYLSKMKYGQKDSDSVWYLQEALNDHSLPAPGNVTLPLTGCYMDQTSTVVVTCQQQHGFGNDPVASSFVGRSQAEHLFAGRGITIKD